MFASRWTPPETADQYLEEIAKAERTQGLPRDLLARLLYQESRFRQDIITGQVRSSAGAVGIAQIVPKWHPNVDPLNPVESIHYAARYLKQLRDQFGSWRLALAAYNWGPGNVSKYAAKPERWPTETKNYVTQILGDLGGVA
ncbi:lytic transglycosylase domain-containing protein [Marinobacter sp.]|uniref:lytic transglycosylase domain-containing protein n=1 Tax=Marinobacter sp. TaxID=50741 RepID=UPI0035C72BF5